MNTPLNVPAPYIIYIYSIELLRLDNINDSKILFFYSIKFIINKISILLDIF